MPGYNVSRASVKNPSLFDKYQCPHCHFLLKNTVQPLCGHWLCESCAAEIFTHSLPKCPLPGCQEKLKTGSEEAVPLFLPPDRFVRREIIGMVLSCPNRSKGCDWEDTLAKLDAHLKTCDYSSEECPQCGTILTLEQMESHKLTCPKAIVECPLSELGCSCTPTMTREELKQHILDYGVEHLDTVAEFLKNLQPMAQATAGRPVRFAMQDITNHSTLAPRDSHTAVSTPLQESGATPQQGHVIFTCKSLPYLPLSRTTVGAYAINDLQASASAPSLDQSPCTGGSVAVENQQLMIELGLRHFLLVEKCADGSLMWKIIEIRRFLSEIQRGSNLAMDSMPFYTGPQGYKMCIRVYLNGDGDGKNSHMSLFFVIMKGEFDKYLEWPFTRKITFKLINQTGGRDIIEAFQPDIMSSSFNKPKSDMNIASGCPRFVSHAELRSGDFFKDDNIFIKCIIEGEV